MSEAIKEIYEHIRLLCKQCRNITEITVLQQQQIAKLEERIKRLESK